MLALVVTAKASTTRASTASRIAHEKKRYYHSNGYIKAIGHVAYKTIYSPNPTIRHKWQHRLRYLIRIRRNSYAKLYALKHPIPVFNDWLDSAFDCIHKYEGAWDANTGNGYYGGLQMDTDFQSHYGRDFVKRWGTADNWPEWAQKLAARRAYKSGRGFYPWPNTARICGLI